MFGEDDEEEDIPSSSPIVLDNVIPEEVIEHD